MITTQQFAIACLVMFAVGFLIPMAWKAIRRRPSKINGRCRVHMGTHGRRHCGKPRPCPDHEAPR
jgi:hypothetical protein